MIRDFEPRLYQQTIMNTCLLHNTLVVLPTGLGKTNIFLMAAAARMRQYPAAKIMLIGPTRPLINQYFETFLRHFDIPPSEMAVFTGKVSPEKRAELWKKARIIFSTPQGLENDIISRRISLADVALLGIDEAHRAVGNYSYVWIAQQYQKSAPYPRIIAMTASPGSDKETIMDVCKNLSIEAIEARTYDDEDVRTYVQAITMEWIKLELPEQLIKIKQELAACYKKKLLQIRQYGYVSTPHVDMLSKKDLLALQAQLQAEIMKGSKDFEGLKTLSLLAEAMKVQHALELIETQSVQSLAKYMHKLEGEAVSTTTKAAKNLVADPHFKAAFILMERALEEGIEHPKLLKIQEIAKKEFENTQEEEKKVIIFSQYRDSAARLESLLNTLPHIRARLFVGQEKKGDTQVTQKEQIEIIRKFKEGAYNTLVMTSVGEEGLDIPSVDLVVFYEPIPSAIRHIQRRGRTGRQEKGRVKILVTRNTRDEAHMWAARHKEQRMQRVLRELKHGLSAPHDTGIRRASSGAAGTQGLMSYDGKGQRASNERNYDRKEEDRTERESVRVIADYRERSSGIIKNLVEKSAQVELTTLLVADYLVSERCAIEYKNQEDFILSLLDGRLLEQLRELKSNYSRPIIMLEGERDLYSIRNIHPNAIMGLISTITVSYGIPIISTKNAQESASMIHMIARREQLELGREFSAHTSKKPMTLKESQEYIISALPLIGPALARELLMHFGSVRGVMNASEQELQAVAKIGDKKAKLMKEVIDSSYETQEKLKDHHGGT